MNSLLETETGEHLNKMLIEELRKQLDVKNTKIENLNRELKSRSDDLNQQMIKHRAICEVRDECKFHVAQLESDMKVLRTENEHLQTQIKEQRETKNSRERALEAQIASYDDQFKKNEEKLKAYESKIAQLEAEKNVTTSPSEKSIDEKYTSSNESSFKIFQFESGKTILKQENDIEHQHMKETQNTTVQTSETHETYTEQIKKYEETIKVYDSKVSQLKTENKEMACKSEKQVDEIKDLQAQLLNYKDSVLKYDEKFQIEKKTNVLLHEELENLKSLCKESSMKTLQPDSRATRHTVVGEMEAGTKGILIKLLEWENDLASFAEQQKTLRMKFEQKIKEKLELVDVSLDNAAQVCNELEKSSPIKTEKANLRKTGKTEEILEKLEKEDNIYKKCSPLKPLNKRKQKTVNAEKVESDRTKTTAASTIPLKKNARKTKKVQDENIQLPLKERDPSSNANERQGKHPSPVPTQSERKLRSRKKP